MSIGVCEWIGVLREYICMEPLQHPYQGLRSRDVVSLITLFHSGLKNRRVVYIFNRNVT